MLHRTKSPSSSKAGEDDGDAEEGEAGRNSTTGYAYVLRRAKSGISTHSNQLDHFCNHEKQETARQEQNWDVSCADRITHITCRGTSLCGRDTDCSHTDCRFHRTACVIPNLTGDQLLQPDAAGTVTEVQQVEAGDF